MDHSYQTACGALDSQLDWEIWEQGMLQQERSIGLVRNGSCIQNLHLREEQIAHETEQVRG